MDTPVETCCCPATIADGTHGPFRHLDNELRAATGVACMTAVNRCPPCRAQQHAVAELNPLSAALPVIRWKRHLSLETDHRSALQGNELLYRVGGTKVVDQTKPRCSVGREGAPRDLGGEHRSYCLDAVSLPRWLC